MGTPRGQEGSIIATTAERETDHASHDGALSAADANRIFYADLAKSYDQSTHCVDDPVGHEMLDGILGRALALLSDDPAVLDACGGSGNVSELLAGRGISTTITDISPEMLTIWSHKAEDLNISTEAIEADIADFLRESGRRWDLIVFSSALHHLDDYTGVVDLACSRLLPGGVLVAAFEPPTQGRTGRALRRLDSRLYALKTDPGSFARRVRTRLHRAAAHQANIGAMAECHAVSGVDESRLTELFSRRGMRVIEYARYSYTRLAWIKPLFFLAGGPNTFHFIVQQSAGGDR